MAARRSKADAERRKRIQQAAASVDRYQASRTRTGRQARADREYIPTGSLELDLRLGGGWVRGRMYELYGPESAGKTTLAMSGIAEAQRLGGIGAFIDVEGAADMQYAETLGVDLDSMLVMNPHDAEDAMEAVREWVAQGVDIIVVDSVAALSPRAERKGEIGDAQVGLQPRLISKTMRVIATDVQAHGSVVIWINQIREKVGVLFGNPETTPGGRALKHYASGRLEVRAGVKIDAPAPARVPRAGAKKKGVRPKVRKPRERPPIGRWVKIHVIKNKTANPFQRAEFPLVFGVGIDATLEAWRLGGELGVFFKSGAWTYWSGGTSTTKKAGYEARWQGEAGFREAMLDGPTRGRVLEAVRDGLRQGGGGGRSGEGVLGHDREGADDAVQPEGGEAAGEAGGDEG